MFRVIEPGITTTVQDAGRWGYQAYGVPVSGAMDLHALRVANQLVQSPPDEAALEIRSAVALESEQARLVAVTGADAVVQINGREMPTWTSIFVRAGALVEVRPVSAGWVYLAVHGAINVPPVLGSKSTCLRARIGGLYGRDLQMGDTVPVGPGTVSDLVAGAGRRASDQALAWAARLPPVRVLLGPHTNRFPQEAVTALSSSAFQVTDAADRMGYRLKGPPLKWSGGELVSCGVPRGAIQVPPDGQPIILMADHQTTGGYPILGVILSADLSIAAQCGTGKELRFQVLNAADRSGF